MKDLQVFSYNEKQVRTVQINGEPWFVLKDVCDVLGISKYRDVVERLDEDERALVKVDTLGGCQNMVAVNESGLYNVILRSDKPEAKPFRKWVTSEVLPSIRKTGTYNTTMLSPAEQLLAQAQLMVEQERRIKALEASSAETTQTVETVMDALDIMVAPSVTAENWQSQMNRNVRGFCMQTGFDFHKTFQELYAELEASAGVKLGVRVKYARKRLLKAGATQTEIASVSKLSLVAQDRKLREIFNSLFNRMVARYTIGNEREVG